MKKLKLSVSILLATLFISSCRNSDEKEIEWICSCEQQKKVAEFITANTKSANNMSDEEMEDVIIELRTTGVQTHCRQKLMYQDFNSKPDFSRSKLDSCEVWMDI